MHRDKSIEKVPPSAQRGEPSGTLSTAPASSEPQPGEMERMQSVQEGSGSAQPSQPPGALPTPLELNESQSDEPQPGETHQAPPRPAIRDPNQWGQGQAKPADSTKCPSKKRPRGPTVKEIPYTPRPEEGYPARVVRPKILLFFVDWSGLPTGDTWSEDQATVGTHTPRIRMVPVPLPGLHESLWMSEYPVMFSTDFGAIVPFDGHPWEQQITFWRPENFARYGPSLTGNCMEALRRQALEGSIPVPPVGNPHLPPQIVDPVCIQVQTLLSQAPPTHFIENQTSHIKVPQNQYTPQHVLSPEPLAVRHLPDQSLEQLPLLDQPDPAPVQQQVEEQADLGQSFDPPPESMDGMQNTQHVQPLDHQQVDEPPTPEQDFSEIAEWVWVGGNPGVLST